MPISENYNGRTFVAFTDISGFKSMMADETRLMRAMDSLYSSGYRVLLEQSFGVPVEGIFISDCGILFARNIGDDNLLALDSLLQVLMVIHRDVFESAFALTTSIAYGQFTYRGKIEFEGLGKTAIHGNAYVAAFKDSDNKTRKMYPNECRIIKSSLPPDITFDQIQTLGIARDRIRNDDKHIYYEWMKGRLD